MIKKIGLGLLIVLVALQLIPQNRENPEMDPAKSISQAEDVPESVQAILNAACYDCHSYETVYPWYAYVAPISFSVVGHINHAREHMNFSLWSEIRPDRRDHVLEEIVEELEKKAMPLISYVNMHPEAKLTDAQREELIEFFSSL